MKGCETCLHRVTMDEANSKVYAKLGHKILYPQPCMLCSLGNDYKNCLADYPYKFNNYEQAGNERLKELAALRQDN